MLNIKLITKLQNEHKYFSDMLKSLEKKLRLVFKEIDDIDKEVEDIARRFRLNKLS